MARITSIKELQTISDDLYTYFVEKLTQVSTQMLKTEVHEGYTLTSYYITEQDKLTIINMDGGSIRAFSCGNNGLIVDKNDGTIVVVKEYEEVVNGRTIISQKRYKNKNGQKTADLKKRAILFELKAKLEVLFKDYL